MLLFKKDKKEEEDLISSKKIPILNEEQINLKEAELVDNTIKEGL